MESLSAIKASFRSDSGTYLDEASVCVGATIDIGMLLPSWRWQSRGVTNVRLMRRELIVKERKHETLNTRTKHKSKEP